MDNQDDNRNDVDVASQLEFICPEAEAQTEVRRAYEKTLTEYFQIQESTPVIALLNHFSEYAGYSRKYNTVLIHVKNNYHQTIVDRDTRPGKQNNIRRFQVGADWAAELITIKLTGHLEREIAGRLGRPVRVRVFGGKIAPDYMQQKEKLTEECWWDALLDKIGIPDPAPLPAQLVRRAVPVLVDM